MKYLIDTNVFMQVLRQRDQAESCLTFLNTRLSQSAITSFSLATLCLLGEKFRQEQLTHRFLISLLAQGLSVLETTYFDLTSLLIEKKSLGLRFDDAIQFATAREHQLTLVTLDQDFRHLKKQISIKTPAEMCR